jgi:hypothetical protein
LANGDHHNVGVFEIERHVFRTCFTVENRGIAVFSVNKRAMGLPTMFDLHITTAFLPVKSMPSAVK